MKPSEKRALREQRLREAEEPAQLEHSAPDVMQSGAVEDLPQEPIAQEYKPYKRKEGFFQAHVRLITFIITATLVMTVLGPLGIDMLVASKNNKGVTNLKDMEMETVFLIHDNASVIGWKNFEKFNYTDLSYESRTGKYFVREYRIANSDLVLKVGGPSTKNHPEYIQLIDYRSGEYVNVLVDDPRDFVRRQEE